MLGRLFLAEMSSDDYACGLWVRLLKVSISATLDSRGKQSHDLAEHIGMFWTLQGLCLFSSAAGELLYEDK